MSPEEPIMATDAPFSAAGQTAGQTAGRPQGPDQGACARCGAPVARTPVEDLCPGCLLRAGLTRPDEAVRLERLLPAYQFLELIGRGGMGSVHRARQRSLDREVAIKLLPADLAAQPGFVARFEREARALARLNHPHIVTVHDSGVVDGHCFLVMEYVAGVSLRQLMRQRTLEPAEALALVPQICDALQYAHEQGIVHRDIKPENILLDTHGRVKIADFGLALLTEPGAAGDTLTATHQVMGTPRYMAPEQMQGAHGVDHRADIYSLGIVFYEMLTGELPMGSPQPPSQRVSVDVSLDQVVLKAMAQSPERRYQHADDVKTAVQGLNATEASAAAAKAERWAAEDDEEGLVWAILAQVLPALGFMGVLWSETWWPLLVLFIPGAAVGSFFPHKRALDNNEVLLILLVLLMSLAAIGVSMSSLESGTPLIGLGVFICGMAAGAEEEKKKLAKKASETGSAQA
jgi:predicted Ser/Thr protein kinase